MIRLAAIRHIPVALLILEVPGVDPPARSGTTTDPPGHGDCRQGLLLTSQPGPAAATRNRRRHPRTLRPGRTPQALGQQRRSPRQLRPRGLPWSQRRRTILQHLQAMAWAGHLLRQARDHLPGCSPPRCHRDLAIPIGRRALGLAPRTLQRESAARSGFRRPGSSRQSCHQIVQLTRALLELSSGRG